MGLQPNLSSDLGDFISSVTRLVLAQAWEGIREMLFLDWQDVGNLLESEVTVCRPVPGDWLTVLGS